MMEAQIIIDLVEGDTDATWFRITGVDLPSLTAIQLNVRREDGSSITKDIDPYGSADPELGRVGWSTGDLVRGRHLAEVVINPGTDTISTLPRKYPIILNVRGDIG